MNMPCNCWRASLTNSVYAINAINFCGNYFSSAVFKTSDIKVVKDCQIFLNFELSSALLVKRFDKLIACCVDTDVQFSDVCDPVIVSLFVFAIVLLTVCFFLYNHYLPCC